MPRKAEPDGMPAQPSPDAQEPSTDGTGDGDPLRAYLYTAIAFMIESFDPDTAAVTRVRDWLLQYVG